MHMLQEPKYVTFVLQQELSSNAHHAPIFHGFVNVRCQAADVMAAGPPTTLYIEMGNRSQRQLDGRNEATKENRKENLLDQVFQHVSEKMTAHNFYRFGRKLKLEQADLEDMKDRYLSVQKGQSWIRFVMCLPLQQ